MIPGHFQSIARVIFFFKEPTEIFQVSHHTCISSLAKDNAVETVLTHTWNDNILLVPTVQDGHSDKRVGPKMLMKIALKKDNIVI